MWSNEFYNVPTSPVWMDYYELSLYISIIGLEVSNK
jgi:hypothetical protein